MATAPMTTGDRHVSIGRVFSRAFGTIRDNPLVVLGLAFVFGALPWTFGRLAGFTGTPQSYETLGSTASSVGVGTIVAVGVVGGVVAMAIWMMTQAVLVRPTLAFSEGRRADVGESVMAGLVVLLWLVLLGILMTIGVVIGLMLIFVPGIMLMVLWSVAIPACVVERVGPFAALARSQALTRGWRWKIFGMWVVVLVVYWIVSALVGVVMAMVYGGFMQYAQASMQGLPIGLIAISLPIQTLNAAVWGTLQAALYVELRDARDGPAGEQLADIFA